MVWNAENRVRRRCPKGPIALGFGTLVLGPILHFGGRLVHGGKVGRPIAKGIHLKRRESKEKMLNFVLL